MKHAFNVVTPYNWCEGEARHTLCVLHDHDRNNCLQEADLMVVPFVLQLKAAIVTKNINSFADAT